MCNFQAVFVFLTFRLVDCGYFERLLLNDLMNDYQKYERPVENEGLPLQLNLTLSLQQIIDLDERNQLLKTNIWLDYTWIDVNLKWNKV